MTFEEYVTARGVALVRVARLLTGDDGRADALVREVLARAYVRWKQIMKTERPDVQVRRLLVAADASRRRRAHPEPSPNGRAVGDATWQRIGRLPRRQRAVLALRYHEDLDDVVIAEILGCSPATVRTHARRALTALTTPRSPA